MPADPQRSTDEKCFCTHCGGTLPSTPTSDSGPVECPACLLPNEYYSPAPNAKLKHSEHPEVLKFFCSFCDQKLSAPSVFAGKEFDCPNCSRSNTVPGETPAPAVTRGLIKFFCTSCGQKLSVESKRIGQHIECPVCNGATLVPKEGVPAPKAPAKLTRPQETEEKSPAQPAAKPTHPVNPAPRPGPTKATAPKPAAPKPVVPKPVVPKPATPSPAATRPGGKPQLIANGSTPVKAPNGTARPAPTIALRKTTLKGKQAAPPSPQKS